MEALCQNERPTLPCSWKTFLFFCFKVDNGGVTTGGPDFVITWVSRVNEGAEQGGVQVYRDGINLKRIRTDDSARKDSNVTTFSQSIASSWSAGYPLLIILCHSVCSSSEATGDWRKATNITGRQPVDSHIPMETIHRIMWLSFQHLFICGPVTVKCRGQPECISNECRQQRVADSTTSSKFTFAAQAFSSIVIPG
jgi:hypothetical protein